MRNLFTLLFVCILFIANATIHNVVVSSNNFTPSSLTIQVGDTVRWAQVNGCHNVNGSQADFPSNPVSFGNGSVSCSNWVYTFQFNTVGTYDYQCDPHAPSMSGTVTVLAAATPFAPGNLAVLRVGDGSSTLNSAAHPVFIDEYSITTGQLVQSIAMPTSVSGVNRRLVLSGTSTSEGSLTLSPDKQYLCLAGYDTTTGTASVAGASTNRTMALVNGAGVVNTSTYIPAGSGYIGSNIRGAVTDGTGVWTSGTGSSNSGGVFYTPVGTSTPTKVAVDPNNNRVVNIFDGQLYVSAASSTFYGVSSVGTGTPTTTGQTTTVLPGFPGATTGSSTYGFVFFDLDATEPGVDVAYLADDLNSVAGGIVKYSKVSGTWVKNNNLRATKQIRGIALANVCGTIRGFVTSDDSVYTFIDDAGYNQNINGAVTGFIGRSSSSVVFRGVSFTPNTPDVLPITANATNVNNVKCFNAANGEATISATGGLGAYTYTWSDNGSGATRTNLAPSVYSVTVSDVAGCSAVVTNISITQPTQLGVNVAKQNVSCFGLSDGGFAAGGTGGTPNYTYNWSTGNGTNLPAGIYTLTVTDSKGCTVVKTDTISQPAQLVLTTTKGNVTCGSTNNGFINTNVTGGNGSNVYAWADNNSSANRANLTPGTYTVTVTDSRGCTASKSDTINQTASLNVTGVVTNVACYGNSNGALDVTTQGGTGVFTFLWADNETSEDRSSLAVGTYVITATDNGGCTGTASFSVTEPDSLDLSTSSTNVSCYGGSNGTATVQVQGGTPNYNYTWSGNANPQALAVGNYTVTVTDSKGCTKETSVSITQPDSINIDVVATDVTCYGNSNGAIQVTTTGGTPNYTINWTGGLNGNNPQSLAVGTYGYTVTDGNNCVKSGSVQVTQPDSLTITATVTDVTVTGGSDGAINLSVSGGTTGYTYNWGNGVTSEDRTALAAGSYTVAVTDANGCGKSATFVVTEPPLSIGEVGEVIWVQSIGLQGDKLNFKVNLQETADLNVEVYTTNGQVIHHESIAAVYNEIVSVNASSLASGIYIVKFTTGSEQLSVRVAVVR